MKEHSVEVMADGVLIFAWALIGSVALGKSLYLSGPSSSKQRPEKKIQHQIHKHQLETRKN